MQRSASAGGGRSTHTIAGTRFPLSSARRSAASCVGWHSTAGTHTSVSSSPDPDSSDPVRGVHGHGHTLRHGLFHALIGTGGSPSARASTSQLDEQTTISSMQPWAASSAVRLRSKARANSPWPISTIVSRMPLEAARRTAGRPRHGSSDGVDPGGTATKVPPARRAPSSGALVVSTSVPLF